jgi:hypothetical protein
MLACSTTAQTMPKNKPYFPFLPYSIIISYPY